MAYKEAVSKLRYFLSGSAPSVSDSSGISLNYKIDYWKYNLIKAQILRILILMTIFVNNVPNLMFNQILP